MTSSFSALIVLSASINFSSQVTVTIRVVTSSSSTKGVGEGYQVLVRESKSEGVIASGYTNTNGEVPLSLNRNKGTVWIEVIKKGRGNNPDRGDGKLFQLPFHGNAETYHYVPQLTSLKPSQYQLAWRCVRVLRINPCTFYPEYRMELVPYYCKVVTEISSPLVNKDRSENFARSRSLDEKQTSRTPVVFKRTRISRTPSIMEKVNRSFVRSSKEYRISQNPVASLIIPFSFSSLQSGSQP